MLREYRAFFRQFRHHFSTTGSLMPSGGRLACALTRPLRSRQTPARILEVGPGTGAVTRRIVPLLSADDRLDLVELNDAFVAYLKQGLSEEGEFAAVRDRVRLFHTHIERFEADGRYDFIVSGLPLNNFSADLVERIFQRFSELLVPGGQVSFFEYMYVRRLRCMTTIGHTRSRLRALDAVMAAQLRRHRARRERVFLNVPPAWAHHLRMPPASIPAESAHRQ